MIDIRYVHSHFNPRAFCNIPAYWIAEDDCGHYYTENDEGQSREQFENAASAYLVQFAA